MGIVIIFFMFNIINLIIIFSLIASVIVFVIILNNDFYYWNCDCTHCICLEVCSRDSFLRNFGSPMLLQVDVSDLNAFVKQFNSLSISGSNSLTPFLSQGPSTMQIFVETMNGNFLILCSHMWKLLFKTHYRKDFHIGCSPWLTDWMRKFAVFSVLLVFCSAIFYDSSISLYMLHLLMYMGPQLKLFIQNREGIPLDQIALYSDGRRHLN